MILIVIAILIIAGLIWFWKGPVLKSADSLEEGGSSKTEAYVIILLVIVLISVAVYMIVSVAG